MTKNYWKLLLPYPFVERKNTSNDILTSCVMMKSQKACTGRLEGELYDPCVLSALNRCRPPWLYDAIYRMFPSGYNRLDYGRISAVKGLMNKRNEYVTRLSTNLQNQPSPGRFYISFDIWVALLCKSTPRMARVRWATNPYTFISSAFANAVVQYCGIYPTIIS